MQVSHSVCYMYPGIASGDGQCFINMVAPTTYSYFEAGRHCCS